MAKRVLKHRLNRSLEIQFTALPSRTSQNHHEPIEICDNSVETCVFGFLVFVASAGDGGHCSYHGPLQHEPLWCRDNRYAWRRNGGDLCGDCDRNNALYCAPSEDKIRSINAGCFITVQYFLFVLAFDQLSALPFNFAYQFRRGSRSRDFAS
jgi:hypothetical protein